MNINSWNWYKLKLRIKKKKKNEMMCSRRAALWKKGEKKKEKKKRLLNHDSKNKYMKEEVDGYFRDNMIVMSPF